MSGIACISDARGLRPIELRLPPIVAGRWVDGLMLFLAGFAWAATAVLFARGVGLEGWFEQGVAAAGGVLAGCMLLMVLCRSRQAGNILAGAALYQPPSFAAIIAVGIFARLISCWLFPATPSSDGATYLGLAQRLISEGRYETAGTLAYWPPGYPAFLLPWLCIFDARLAVLVSQIFLFVVGAFGCLKLASHLAGQSAGRWSALLFALWPNLVALAGTPEKEALVVALLPWVFLGALKCSIVSVAPAGVALGAAILVQPSLQLLLPALVLLMLVLHGGRRVLASIVLIFSAALVILPWTIRNHEIFGEFVLVSTNGGDNFYRANNPLANGGYTPVGELEFVQHGEVKADRAAKQAAFEWIERNTTDFLLLIPEKQLRFMGDDAAGVYSALKRGGGSDSELTYTLVKLFANIWWLLAWLVVALLCCSRKDTALSERTMVWPFLYLFVLHSVFESSGKYHIPMLWTLCVWLGCGLAHSGMRVRS